jgi:hypothetical protein
MRGLFPWDSGPSPPFAAFSHVLRAEAWWRYSLGIRRPPCSRLPTLSMWLQDGDVGAIPVGLVRLALSSFSVPPLPRSGLGRNWRHWPFPWDSAPSLPSATHSLRLASGWGCGRYSRRIRRPPLPRLPSASRVTFCSCTKFVG